MERGIAAPPGAHSKHFVTGLPFKAHKIEGFSPEMLEHYYEEIYGGAVRRLNVIEAGLASDPLNPELRKDLLRVSNAIILHEIYLASLAEDGGAPLNDDRLRRAVEESFGTLENWRSDFVALVQTAPGGWGVLAWSNRFHRLMNLVLEDAAQAALDAVPLLAVDLDARAYGADFGEDRAGFLAAFLRSIHWGRIADRFRLLGAADPVEACDGTQISVVELSDRLESGEDILVLDVRHEDDRERYTRRIMTTDWRDSFDVARWAAEMPKDRPVVVYCMYGFWVSQKAAKQLREHGVDARSLAGGITAWRAMGLPSTPI
ncbi:MAG: Fe-Mn family superoxide dismutase [Pseudomonadota bacterium]